MATDVIMPRLSDSMEEGTILRWIVTEGGAVKRGEPLVEIETDKANMVYDADTDGTLIEIVAGEGATLPIGEPIARIGDPSEAGSNGASASDGQASERASEDGEEQAAASESAPVGAPPEKRETSESAPVGAPPEKRETSDGERPRASPVARRMAREMGVDLGAIEGSGPGGRIVKADVERVRVEPVRADERTPADGAREERRDPSRAQAPPPGDGGPKGEAQTVELSRIQRTVARRMAESKATAPDYELRADVDMSSCVELREQLREVLEAVPTYNDMIVRACALALRESPRINGAYRDGHFELYSRVNVGVAVAAQDALVVPTVFDADRKGLGEIARTTRELASRVREGTVTPPELSGATFTVSNLGMYGIDSFTAVINPPQAAILAVGALKRRPWVDEASGRVVAREAMTLTLACDHRILYGAEGAQFLARVKTLLEQPVSLAV